MIGQYLLDSFKSHSVSLEEGILKFDEVANFIVNLFYGFSKFLWQIFDLIIHSISNSNVYKEQVNGVFDIANQLHSLLYGQFGQLFIMFTLLFIFIHYIFKHRVRAQLLTLLFVVGVNLVMFTDGQRLLTGVQELSVTIESEVAKIASQTMVQSVFIEQELVEKLPDREEIEAQRQKEEEKTTTDQVRELLYFQMVQQPFALLNFGQYEFEEEKMSPFLIPGDTTDIQKAQTKVDEELKKIKTEKKEADYLYMTSLKTTEKIFMSLFILINGVCIGGVMVLVAIVFLLIQLAVLGLVLLLPIVSVLSLLPWFSHALAKALAKILSLFGLTLLITVVATLLFFFLNIIDRVGVSVMGVGALTYFANFLLKGAFLFFAYKYHAQLIAFVTGGAIRSKISLRGGKEVQRIVETVKDKITSPFQSVSVVKNGVSTHSEAPVQDSIQEAFQESDGFSKRRQSMYTQTKRTNAPYEKTNDERTTEESVVQQYHQAATRSNDSRSATRRPVIPVSFKSLSDLSEKRSKGSESTSSVQKEHPIIQQKHVERSKSSFKQRKPIDKANEPLKDKKARRKEIQAKLQELRKE